MWRFFKKLKMEIPFDPGGVHLLGIFSKELKTSYHNDLYVPYAVCMILAAQLITAKSWKQFICPSTDE